jgi:hypothetical protein
MASVWSNHGDCPHGETRLRQQARFDLRQGRPDAVKKGWLTLLEGQAPPSIIFLRASGRGSVRSSAGCSHIRFDIPQGHEIDVG